MVAMNNALRSYNQGMGRMNYSGNTIAKQKLEPGINNINSSNNAYQNNMVNTATPQELTLMLYNGLVKFLKLAYQGIEEKNIEKANNNVIRAQDIITEFMSTLDMQYEVSNGLMSMYEYMNRRLLEANIKKDKDIVGEVIGYAEELRDTWAQAMKLARQQSVSSK